MCIVMLFLFLFYAWVFILLYISLLKPYNRSKGLLIFARDLLEKCGKTLLFYCYHALIIPIIKYNNFFQIWRIIEYAFLGILERVNHTPRNNLDSRESDFFRCLHYVIGKK
jgi:hypothetical protein